MNINLVKNITIGSLVGGIIGYLILHPAFLIMDDYYFHGGFNVSESFLSSFSIFHIQMIVFFIIFGIINGLLDGFFNYRIRSLIEKTHIISNTDELTQISNRRHFMNELNKEIERAKRFSRNLSLMILDIDKFKYYNDTYGHIFGDKVIQSVARSLAETIRKIDFVARYGGDEFVIVMPETEKAMANIFAERVQKKFSENFFENKKIPLKLKISLSIGIASFPNDVKTADDLIHHADTALYRAKEEKRRQGEFLITI